VQTVLSDICSDSLTRQASARDIGTFLYFSRRIFIDFDSASRSKGRIINLRSSSSRTLQAPLGKPCSKKHASDMTDSHDMKGGEIRENCVFKGVETIQIPV
jgi:hypothetical protein